MSPLTQALEEIDYWINLSKSWHANHIRSTSVYRNCPGLEREMIDLYSEECEFQFSEEIYEFYQWHDGGMLIGDMSNPVYFSSLDNSIGYCIKEHLPYQAYLPLFIGDDAFYVIFEASETQDLSPIFFFDGRILPGRSRPSWGTFKSGFYSPSVTSLMQAIAECTKVYDGFSAEYMLMDNSTRTIYLDHTRHVSILTPIYKKYGVLGDSSGLWR